MSTKKYYAFGEYVLSKRKQQGIASQAELAQLLGVRQQTVSRWEAGASRPRANDLGKLAGLLKVDIAEISAIAGYASDAVTVSFDRPLPLAGLSPESFESFSLDLLLSLYREEEADVHPAGKTGHKQYGIDIEARFSDGNLYTFQCKRENQFGVAKVRKAVKAQTISANKKHILLSRVASPEARKEVLKTRGWNIWDQTDITHLFRTLPKSEQIRIVDIYFPSQRFALTGEMNPGPWLTAEEFFAPFLADVRVFNQGWELVGRASELDQLAQALADRNVVVTSLIGRAGEGKSRVLRSVLEAFTTDHPHVRVVVASATEEIDAKSLEELGAGEKLLVVDDAHDRRDIEQLIRYAADDRSNARLLLVYRPYWYEVVQTEMARTGLSGNLVRAVTLAKPTKKDAVELASQVLAKHGASMDSAEMIADIAYDSPLAVVVGAQIVAKEGVHPELFRSSEDFRMIVLKRYEQMIAEDIATGKDQDRVSKMLRILALIQPVVPDDQPVIELLASMEGIDAPDASRLARLLIDSGVLFKRGARYRLSPDLLADSIIETACISSGGKSNGYAERVFEAAIPELQENVLLNLGRLDWRRNEGDTSKSQLLDDIWAKLKWEDDYRNAQVKAAASAAYYQPRHALEFARRLIDQGHGNDTDVCRMINMAAHTLGHVREACGMLWEIGKDDRRATNQHPSHPIRILTELATPAPRKPAEFCEEIVDFALSLLPYDDSWAGAFTPFDILKGALATEGHFTSRSTSRAVTFSAYGVNNVVVGPMRRRIIDAVLESLTCGHKQRAFFAAELLGGALRGPFGILNRQPSDTEQAAWSHEFLDTLTRVNGVLDANHVPPVVLVRIGESVSWHAHYPDGETKIPARRILSHLDRDLETRVTRALIDGWGHITWKIDVDAKNDSNKQRQELLAEEIKAAYPNVAELARFLEDRLADIKSYVGDGFLESARNLVQVLIEGQLDFARAVLEVVQRAPQSPLADYGSFALASLLRHAPDEGHKYIDEILTLGNDHLPFIAFAYAIGALGERQLDDKDRHVIRRIFGSSDPSVLIRARGIFREMAEKDRQFAIDLLADVNPEIMRDTDNDIFMWLDDGKHISFDSISDEDLERIMDLFLIPNRIDGYHVHRFLAKVSKRSPRQVLELVKARLERAVPDKTWGYWPVGTLVDVSGVSFNLLVHPDGPAMFRDTLDWALSRATDRQFTHRFANLVGGVFGFEEQSFASTLEAWSAGGSADHFALLAAVLDEAPNQFVFREYDFVLRILRAARSVGKATYEAVRTSLYLCSVSGSRSGTPGQPFPEDEMLKERSEKALATLSKADPAYGLFEDLRKHAEDAIERQLAEGRAMDEEDADL